MENPMVRDPERSNSCDTNTLRAQYLENSWS